MCGRYDNLIAREAYRSMYKAMRVPASNFPPRYNIAPTDPIPIVRVDPRDSDRELVMARWRLIPGWMKEKPKIPHINARAETVHKAPLFREAFAKRRCLIPATGFFEWQTVPGGKQPWRFVRKDLEPFAGIWEFARLGGADMLSACIIVGEPNPLVAGVHDRMPVMLMPGDYDRWLDPALRAARVLLGWSQQLADKAIISLNALVRFETGKADPRASMVLAIERALTKDGIEFLPAAEKGEGVRLRKPSAGDH